MVLNYFTLCYKIRFTIQQWECNQINIKLLKNVVSNHGNFHRNRIEHKIYIYSFR